MLDAEMSCSVGLSKQYAARYLEILGEDAPFRRQGLSRLCRKPCERCRCTVRHTFFSFIFQVKIFGHKAFASMHFLAQAK